MKQPNHGGSRLDLGLTRPRTEARRLRKAAGSAGSMHDPFPSVPSVACPGCPARITVGCGIRCDRSEFPTVGFPGGLKSGPEADEERRMTAFRPRFVLLCPLLVLAGCAGQPVPVETSAVAACSEVRVVDANRPPPTPAPAAMPAKPAVAVTPTPVLAKALAPVAAVAPTPAPAETPRVSVSWLRPTAAPGRRHRRRSEASRVRSARSRSRLRLPRRLRCSWRRSPGRPRPPGSATRAPTDSPTCPPAAPSCSGTERRPRIGIDLRSRCRWFTLPGSVLCWVGVAHASERGHRLR